MTANNLYYYMLGLYIATQKPIKERVLYLFLLREECSAEMIPEIITMLERAYKIGRIPGTENYLPILSHRWQTR